MTAPRLRRVRLEGGDPGASIAETRAGRALATERAMSEQRRPIVAAAPFGSVLVEHMVLARWRDGSWSEPRLSAVEPLRLHPAAHVLHYASACFEGLKAHRGLDGVVRAFRVDRHVARLQDSAKALVLPVPDRDMVTRMIVELIDSSLAVVPDAPGSLYVRPTLIGTEANIGAAASPSGEALLYVLASPVGDYFAGGRQSLVLAIETQLPRSTPQFGTVKAGANYAMALRPTTSAAQELGSDQVLFAPEGKVTETGAANIMLLDSERVVSPALSDAFLHGVTRDSILVTASMLGYVVEERPVTVDEVLAWACRPDGEIALAGTAAVLAGVGTVIHAGERRVVGTGGSGPVTASLRRALTDVQTGRSADLHRWLTQVPALPANK